METFDKKLKFISKTFDQTLNAGKGDWVETQIEKTATFYELERTNKLQHKLHFKIITVFESNDPEEGEQAKMTISSDAIYDLTVKAFRTLIILNDEFTEVDKNEFLNDSAAIFDLGKIGRAHV